MLNSGTTAPQVAVGVREASNGPRPVIVLLERAPVQGRPLGPRSPVVPLGLPDLLEEMTEALAHPEQHDQPLSLLH